MTMRRGAWAWAAVSAAALAAWPRLAAGQEWTRFRGPNGTGLAKAAAETIPVTWTEGEFNWKVKLPGTGRGSPVVWGDRIFLVCAEERTAARRVVCLSAANGGSIWTRSYKSAPHHRHRDNSHAGVTPSVDKDRVYVSWGSAKRITLLALDHDGKDVWRLDLGGYTSQHGPCTSHLLFEDMVVLANDQQGESFVIAVDAATGKTRWKLPRKPGRAAYSTPCVYRRQGKAAELIVTGTAGGVTAIDPKTGKVTWQRAGELPARVVGSPAVAGDLVIASCGTGGRGVRLVAVRPADGGKAEVAYTLRSGAPYVPTPLVTGGLLFVLEDRGGVACRRAASGDVVWREKLPDRFYGSFVCVGERLYCMSRTGWAYVLAAGEEYRLLARNPIGERSSATPAVAGGRMYLRTWSHLISLGGKKQGRH